MGFTGLDQIVRAQTVLDDAEDWDFEKTPVTAGALVAGSAYDFYEAPNLPFGNLFPIGSTAFKAVRNNNGVPQAGGVGINAINMLPPTGGKTRHLTYLEHDGGNVAGAVGDIFLFDLLGFYCDFNLAGAGTQLTGTGVGVADVTRYTNGVNVLMYVVTQVVLAGASPTLTIAFTDGTLSSVNTAAMPLTPAAVRGQIPTTGVFKIPTPKGVVAVRSVTFSAGPPATGKLAIMLVRQLGKISHTTAQQSKSKSFLDPAGEFRVPKWDSDAVPAFAFRARAVSTSPIFGGQFQTTKGYAT